MKGAHCSQSAGCIWEAGFTVPCFGTWLSEKTQIFVANLGSIRLTCWVSQPTTEWGAVYVSLPKYYSGLIRLSSVASIRECCSIPVR